MSNENDKDRKRSPAAFKAAEVWIDPARQEITLDNVSPKIVSLTLFAIDLIDVCVEAARQDQLEKLSATSTRAIQVPDLALPPRVLAALARQGGKA